MERNRKKRNYKKERGITLVALIITIIVMLILVAVTVRVVVESDIIGVAEKAAESKETGELKDQIAMKIGEWQLGKYVEDTKNTPLTEYLDDIAGVTVEGTDKMYVVTKGDTVITVNEKGEMTTSGEFDILDLDNEGKPVKEMPDVADGNIYIHNAEQFKYLADSVNGELGEGEEALTITADTKVYLMANLDLGARAGTDGEWGTADDVVAAAWTPIGIDNDTHKFIGAFEGNGHVIRGVYVSITGEFGGILGNTTNTIQNLIVKDSYIKSEQGRIGGIVGAARAGEIVNCHNINTYVTGKTKNVGGIAGQSQATIVDCSNSGTICSNGLSDGNSSVGGIAGLAACSVQNCRNFGAITGNGTCTGGIVGLFHNDYVIKECSNSGSVQGLAENTGGICGQAKQDSQIIACKNENTGSVTGIIYVGGIAGSTFGTIEKCYNEGDITAEDSYLGGIAGIIETYGATALTIQNTYNTGELIATSDFKGLAGGVVGGISQGNNSTTVNINNNYNVGTITIEGTGVADIGGAIGSIEAPSTVTVNADRNYYLAGVVTPNISHTKETSKTEMKSEQFVKDLNTGLQEAAWVETSGYPALIGM